MKSWRRQALFQGRHCFCPTPTLGGGGVPVKEAGTHSPPCPQYLPLVHPAQGWNRHFTLNLFPHKISAWPSLLQLAP